MTITTRFAPSPTGDFHLGSARTALYCYLYAKAEQGEFILRIEDTDRERSTDAAIQVILAGMQWLGLTHDSGPYYQTKRMDRYQEALEKLLAEGKAYRCYCSKERLADLREQQMQAKGKPRYDGRCRHQAPDVAEGAPYVIRFKNPLEGSVVFEDLIRGVITINNAELDDLIIARSDGSPTYNFTVVVDDADMTVTHVVRGEDHINNTPRQINIFNALGLTPPKYAHVPMILGEDGKKLSKRHGATSVLQYRDEGYLPQALINYLVRLGWSHGDQEVFSMAEMIKLFDLNQVHRAAAAFSLDKLKWLNQHYLKTLPAADVAEHFAMQCQRDGLTVSEGPSLAAVVAIQAERCHTLAEMVEKSRYFFQDFSSYDEKAAKKNFKAETASVLTQLLAGLEALVDWRAEPIHAVIEQVAALAELKLGKVAQPLRVAVTGGSVSPPIDITCELIGQSRVVSRLQQALRFLEPA